MTAPGQGVPGRECRVLHLTTRYPPGPGGVERHVRELVRRQRARGFDARVVTSDLYTEIPWVRLPPGPRDAWALEEGVPVLRHRAWSLPGELHYPFLPGLYSRLRREHPDLLHVHTYGTYQGFSALASRRLNRTPWVLTAHFHPTWSIWGGERRKSLRRLYDRYLAGPVVRSASRVVVQTPEEGRLLREVVEPDHVVEIPPGYSPLPPPPQGSGGFRARYGVPGPFLLFVGRLASNKGLKTLVEAFSRITGDHPDLFLVLVGEDGGDAAALQEDLRGRGLESRARWVGFVPEESLLASAYAEATALVLPSEYEAFGLVLLEALAQGTPVVASRVGGIPGIVEDGRNGLLVPPGDASALAQALQDLLSDPARARAMGHLGRTETVPRFTWDRVAEGLEEVYRQVLAEGKGSR